MLDSAHSGVVFADQLVHRVESNPQLGDVVELQCSIALVASSQAKFFRIGSMVFPLDPTGHPPTGRSLGVEVWQRLAVTGQIVELAPLLAFAYRSFGKAFDLRDAVELFRLISGHRKTVLSSRRSWRDRVEPWDREDTLR